MTFRGKGRLFRIVALALVISPALTLTTMPSNAADPDEPVSGHEVRLPGGDQRVTLRLRDMEITEALQLLGQRSKLSFVVAPDVKGKVNLDFYNESVNRILETILASNNLQIRQVGGSYVVSSSPSAGLAGVKVYQLNYTSADTLGKVLVAALKSAGIAKPEDQIIADPRSNSIVASGNEAFHSQVKRLVGRLDQPQEHKIYRLNYIKAEEAATLLSQSLFAGAQNTGVKFVPIVRENALMVVASHEDLRLAGEVLAKVDRPLRQVLIEVKLVELNGTASNLLGVTFDAQTGTVTGGFDATTGTTINYNPLQNALSQVRARINALLRDNKAKLLASPSLVAMDSKESRIEITDDIIEKVLNETTVNANTTIIRQNVTLGTAGITLGITPKINPDNFISMKVEPEISFIRETVRGQTGTDILATLKSRRKLNTPEVRVRDGETLIIGGLNQERTQETVDKVPVLGDIPLLGHVFRRTSQERVVTELVVLLTPKVVPDGTSITAPPFKQ
ncbi:putative type II secretion system protein D precursor [compost metagenome]